MCNGAEFGFNPHMTLWLAIRVAWWRIVRGETWRGIAYDYFPYDKNNDDEELRGNQFYGMEIMEAVSSKLHLWGHGAWPLNGSLASKRAEFLSRFKLTFLKNTK